MKQKNIRSLFLTLCLLLTACGQKSSGNEPVQLSGAAACTSKQLSLDLSEAEITASGVGNGCLYLAGREEEEIDLGDDDADGEFTSGFTVSGTAGDDGGFTFYSGGISHASLYRLDVGTGAVTKLEGYVPGEGMTVAAIVPCENGSLWVLEQSGGDKELLLGDMSGLVSSASAAGYDGSSGGKVWRKLDASGVEELERVDVTDIPQVIGAESVTDTRMDREGCLYAASGATLTVLDAKLSTLFTCKTQETIERLISLGDGGVGVVTAGGTGRTVYPVDAGEQSLGSACFLTGSGNRIYAGNEQYGFLYNSGDSLYGWPAGASKPEKVLGWSGAGVDMGQVTALALLTDGAGAAVTRDSVFWPVSYSVYLLTPVSEEELAGRMVLTLATLGLNSETRAQILEFNRTSGTWRIEVRDYSEYNTPDDASAGVSKLNTEILAGDLPDLLDVSDDMPLRQYAAKGLLEDLWPYIESDTGLGREGVMERVLEAAEIDGKLVRVFPRFYLETAAGNPAVLGTSTGWTLDELRTALEKQGSDCSVLGPDETKTSVLEDMFADNLENFVNWDEGSARFDSPEFAAILEFCNTFPAQVQSQGEEYVSPYTWVARGEQMLLPVSLGDLTSIQIYRALFGGDAAFAGYPSEGGSGVRFGVEGGIAMMESCRDKGGAWSFMRQMLLAEGDRFTFGFPVNRANFEKSAQESMEITYLKDENGDPIVGPDGEPMMEGTAYVFLDTQAVMLSPPTQEDYDEVMALYERADSIAGRDKNIWNIVQDGAGAYFAGDRTADEAAQAIQSRVELYLNEQK